MRKKHRTYLLLGVILSACFTWQPFTYAAQETATITPLSWIAPSTRADGTPLSLSDIAGYRVYSGMDRNNLALVADINNGSATSYPLTGLSSGTHYFSLTTYDYSNNESTRSDIVSRTVVTTPDPDQADEDGDGVADAYDNCILAANTWQRDTDGDNIGNACDADLNNDGAINFADLGMLKSVFFTADEDADFNGDGAVNFADLGIFNTMFFKAPGPSGLLP